MSLLRALADRRRPGSLSAWFRRRRAGHLASLLATVPRPLTILDIGGEQVFWDEFPLTDGISVVLLNLDAFATTSGRFSSVRGDARDLAQFADQSFEVVVSNSVLEHVGGPVDQRRAAEEIVRVARRYYVQTPNRWFPVDPHFLIPFFHLLPWNARVWWLTRFNAGWLTATHDRAAAAQLVDGVQLLDARSLRRLFPKARLWRERIAGLTKSLVVYDGW